MKKSWNAPLLIAIGLAALAVFLYLLAFPGGNSVSSRAYSLDTAGSEGGYQRIICATPSVTEIVFALGSGQRVVGVSDFTFFPSEAKDMTSIGGMINPNKERIIHLQPDLIIFQGKHDSLARFSQQSGIPYLSVPIDSLQDIVMAIHTIGKKLGEEAQATQLANTLQTELQTLRSKTEGLPSPKVFLTLGHTPGDLSGLMTTGPGTFLHELVELAGGQNLFSDASGLYPQISKEALIMRQPDIIIEVFAEGITHKNQTLLRKDWERLSDMPAVKTGNIHFITDDFLLIPSMRVVQTAKKLIEIIHPESLDEQLDRT
ncbi:MAG: ABC transporter substrate-binding protein [Candidatus Aminicenantes bacterium]|nr:ABC transporter substrate-binding protein [Candidatus Aminicenantes bacterium]